MRNAFWPLVACTLLLLSATPATSQTFTVSDLDVAVGGRPTSLAFGPDGRLYVAIQTGRIRAFTVVKNGSDDYESTATENIDLVRNIPNHDDDGTVSAENTRQVTGIATSGTAANPIVYVTSSDPRIGAGGAGDLNLDTNSGIISRLTWNGSSWDKVDLVRGLPRSEENHASNGLFLDEANSMIYVAQGGHTNAGGTSINFAYQTEYALSSAILEIDLAAIEAMPVQGTAPDEYIYDLPTLDDPDRAGATDLNDPFGGNDGLNQAKLVPGGPVQVYSGGFRNAYDVVITEAGHMFSVDNGPNGGWGGYPDLEGTPNCTNDYVIGEPGASTNKDGLHLVTAGYYAGHPNPVRGNPASAGIYTHDGTTGVFRTSTGGADPLPADWPPVPLASATPDECDFQLAGTDDGSLYVWDESTNGMAEYTASGSINGDLLVAGFDGNIYRVDLDAAGTGVDGVSLWASSFGGKPLDVTVLPDGGTMPGTVWTANYGSKTISVFEPSAGGGCTGADDPLLDEDADGYDNADEIDAGSNPCSAASLPEDHDGDLISNVNDPDDDNDGLTDIVDRFPLDTDNGSTTAVLSCYEFFNDDPGTGFFGIGFTGLMTDGTSDYLTLFDPDDDLVGGGASGLFTDPTVGSGTAVGSVNDQVNAFQLGIPSTSATTPFVLTVQINGPFFGGASPAVGQTMGLFLGTGDQDNFVRLVAGNAGGSDGLVLTVEEDGHQYSEPYPVAGLFSAASIQLQAIIDPVAGSVQAAYTLGGTQTMLGGPVLMGTDMLEVLQGAYMVSGSSSSLAVGVMATSGSVGSPYAGTWDNLCLTPLPAPPPRFWTYQEPINANPERHENAFVEVGGNYFAMGGRSGAKSVRKYTPSSNSWSGGANPGVEMHHFQAVAIGETVYAIGALTGSGGTETAVTNVYEYDTDADSWTVGAALPAGRERGSTGAVVYDQKIYVLGGLTGGHGAAGTSFALFDEFDPATGTWTTLPDAPRVRDHFHAVVHSGKLYAIGGRDSGTAGFLGATIPEVDVYDFEAGTWSTLSAAANVLTERAGGTNVLFEGQIFFIGGESEQPDAHDEVETFDPVTETWTTRPPLIDGRHGTQALVDRDEIWIVSGSLTNGGGDEADTFEHFGPEDVSLAVELSSLDVKAHDDIATVTWSTSSEIGSSGFDVSLAPLLASSKIKWQSVGFIEAKGGPEETASYSFELRDLAPGVYRIRLSELEQSGKTAFVGDLEFTIAMKHKLDVSAVYPNPARDFANLEFTLVSETPVSVDLYDNLGKRVRNLYSGTAPSGVRQQITFETGDLANGLYFLRVIGNETTHSEPVIILN